MNAADAARIATNHTDQRARLLERLAQRPAPVRAEYEITPASDLDAEERWYALHDSWAGEH